MMPCFAEGALATMDKGDLDGHDQAAARAAAARPEADVTAPGRFSLSRANKAVAAARHWTVLTTPDSAVRKMQRLLLRKEAA